MSMQVGPAGRGPHVDINMTPMIDILLVLIIIFMVITPLKPVGLDALLPQQAHADQEQQHQDRAVVIQIAADGALRINTEPVEVSDLGRRLNEIFSRRAERVIFVQGHSELEFSAVAHVIDVARGAGIHRVGLMTN